MLISSQDAATSTLPDDMVQVKYSPTVEMAASLHALAQDTGVDTVPYLRECEHWIDAGHNDEFARLGSLTGAWSLLMDLACYIEQSDIDNVIGFISNLSATDSVDLAYGLLSGLVSKASVKERLTGPSEAFEREAEAAGLYSVVSPNNVQEMMARFDTFKTQLSDLLRSYWKECFAEIWDQIGVRELAVLRTQRELLQHIGSGAYLKGCHAGIYLTDQRISFERRDERTYPISSISAIDVIISAFIGRELMCNKFGNTLTVYCGIAISPTGSVDVPDEVIRFLRAISNVQRLQILGSLMESPKTTKELSEIFEIAPSSVSVHLKVMRQAELVYPQRMSGGVYYRFLYENYRAQASYVANLFDGVVPASK